MKRDAELVRHILFAVESAPEGESVRNSQIDLDGHSATEISEHIQLLIQAGFLEGTVSREIGPVHARTCIIWRMTWAGYEYLDSVRDPRVWKRTKEIILSKGGSLAFELIKDIATRFLKQGLDLPPG